MNGTKPDADAADVFRIRPEHVVEERSLRVEGEGKPTLDCREVIMRT